MTILCPACLIENSKGALYCNICGYILSELEDSNNSSTNYPLALKSGSLLKQDTYQIQQTLGQGGFGIVYQALNINNQKTFAIKEFFPERSSRQKNRVIWSNSIVPKDRQEFIKEFLLEGHNLSLCSPYPNIVQIHEWFEENNTGYIVMQLVKGKSLDQILKTEKRLSEAKIKIYFIKIAQTLKIVHQHRLLHRDIKPDNIIINEQDEPILIDFGNAKEYIAGKTQSMSAIATLEYAPLEQLTSYAHCISRPLLLTPQLASLLELEVVVHLRRRDPEHQTKIIN
jgi:serine/threonine protein kinase